MSDQIILPIETRYRGYRFRSRLEARWAVFFDAAGIEWRYEAEGFNVDGVRYLPDFELPQFKTIVEVKPDEESAKAAAPLLRTLVSARSCQGIIIFGAPHVEDLSTRSPNIIDVTAGPEKVPYDSWLECPFCHHVWLGDVKQCGCPPGVELLDEWRIDNSLPRLRHALSQAQRARFEHGEDGKPRPFIAPTISQPMTVYLAGAVSERCGEEGEEGSEQFLEWRREIFPSSCAGDNSYLDMQPGQERIGLITYGGPRIDSGNHGLATDCIHGREAGHSGNNAEIAERCLEQLRACNALFVWIDRIETIGTMIEIGAAFQRMPIFVAFANRELAGRAYFAAQLADVAVITPSAGIAWKLFTQWQAQPADDDDDDDDYDYDAD